MKHLLIAFTALLVLVTIGNCSDCDIIPEDIIKPKNKNDFDRYIISIQGNPKTYAANQKYNVSLKVNANKLPQKAFRQFFLTLESVDGDTDAQAYRPTGQFDFERNSQLITRFSDMCRNTVIENSKMPKWEVQVYWIAPPEGSGCVAIKATVVESRENWFSEDGQLTKILCEDSEIDENVKPPPVDKCCACSEAKYEVAFEGRWTRNTHPRNYPSDIWSTKFSDIIGASHRKYHSFWNEQDYASDGLKDLAETGNTHNLESEIKVMGTNIRTIIKARGLQHPNITDISYAVFRVDSSNHLVSLVSKITPSPDWFVGVNNFELCKSDCTWAESYTLNMYPMDAGTNDGIGYLSSEPLRFSHKIISSITPNNPNDPQSPFYDEDGNPMNPIAKLHFTRQRLYEKPCDSSEDTKSEEEDDCATTKWGDWTPCSVPCGLGKRTRMRQYLVPKKAQECYVRLVQHQTCLGTAKYCKNAHYKNHKDSEEEEEGEEGSHENEETSGEKNSKGNEQEEKKSDENGSKEEKSEEKKSNEEKGSEEAKNSEETKNSEEAKNSEEKVSVMKWSGKGTFFKKSTEKTTNSEENISGENKSKQKGSDEKESTKEESGSEEKASDEKEDEEKRSIEEECAVGEWSEWSSCSVTCGRGTKTRDRKLLHPQNEEKCEDAELQDNAICRGTQRKCDDDTESKCSNTNWGPWSSCSVSCGTGQKRRLRLPPEPKKNSKKSNDDVEEDCSISELVRCHTDCSDLIGESLIVEQAPDGRVVNCKVSGWSIWSKCVVQTRGETCGRGTKKRSRQILRHSENGGQSCPRKLFQTRTCTIDCPSSSIEDNSKSKQSSIDDKSLKCIMSGWTEFTPCSSICGSSAMQLKTRKILYKPPGAVCPSRVIYKPCNLPLACTSDGRPIFL